MLRCTYKRVMRLMEFLTIFQINFFLNTPILIMDPNYKINITNPAKTSSMIQMVVNFSKDVTSVMFKFLQISTDVTDVVVNLIHLTL